MSQLQNAPERPAKLTAVIPVVKDDFLGSLLSDIRNNVTKPNEIVVIDNGNGIAQAICEQFPDLPIRYLLQQQNLGVNASWNLGLKEAKFELVSILNDDLIIPDRFFEMILLTFENHQQAGFVVPQTVSDPKGVGCASPPVVDRLLNREGWAFTIRKNIVTPIPEHIFTFFGDDWFYRQVIEQGYWPLKITNNRIFHHVGISRNLAERDALGLPTLDQDRTAWHSLQSTETTKV